MSLFNNLAIDLGTSNTLVHADKKGVVYNEPSVVAIGIDISGRRKVLAVGKSAKEMLGRTPDKIKAIRPLKNGVIADFEIAQAMLKEVIKKSAKNLNLFKPRILICIPHGVTEVEKRAVQEAAQSAGAKEVLMIDQPIAAAIGAGLPITAPCGNMIIDIGGGTTEVAVISMNGIVYSQSVRIGGYAFDEAISNYARRALNILIGEQTAEQVKLKIANLLEDSEYQEIELSGRDIVQGVPKTVKINSDQVRAALNEPLMQIIAAIQIALEKTPPELSADLYDSGITLTGGGAMLPGMANLISSKTDLKVVVAKDPLQTLVKGAGMLLSNLEYARDLTHDVE